VNSERMTAAAMNRANLLPAEVLAARAGDQAATVPVFVGCGGSRPAVRQTAGLEISLTSARSRPTLWLTPSGRSDLASPISADLATRAPAGVAVTTVPTDSLEAR
jgi:hypothetical protein